jgi:putative endopeptidase
MLASKICLSGLNKGYLLPSVRPQDDLFRSMNGTFLDNEKIAADQSYIGPFNMLYELSQKQLNDLIQEIPSEANGEARKVRDLYATFMTEEEIEKAGLTPLNQYIDLIKSVRKIEDLPRVFGILDNCNLGGSPFSYGIGGDQKDSNVNVMYFGQSGINLPDEAYYREEQNLEIRNKYKVFIENLVNLAGVEGFQDGAVIAESVLELETALASFHYDIVKNGEADKTYHETFKQELVSLLPSFNWEKWLDTIKANPASLDRVIVSQPEFFTGLETLLTPDRITQWKYWLFFNLLDSKARSLPKAFADLSFDFYNRTMWGIEEERPRWFRGVGLVNGCLREVIGKLYVERYFPPEAKAGVQKLVENLLSAYHIGIGELNWMSEETKLAALDKLDKVTVKIGYPDKWKDYSGLTITAGDLVGNLIRISQFYNAENLAKFGVPVDRSEWHCGPQEVNAFYWAEQNEILFPAAILQAPFYDLSFDDAVNYGSIGATIGHEISHGFDDQGSKFDGNGNMIDWWLLEDKVAFEALTKKIANQFNGLEPHNVPGGKVNGELTLGENIADLSGLRMAFEAYLISQGGKEAEIIDGFTPAQLFFAAYSQSWAEVTRPETILTLLASDSHSPAEFRVNTIVSNLDEFHEAFGVIKGDGLYRERSERVKIW